MDRSNRLFKIKNIIKVSAKRSNNYAALRDIFAANYPQLDFGGLGEDFLSWLKFRYIDELSERDEVIYPIDKALFILRKFSNIQNKWKSDLEFRNKLSSEGFEDISSIKSLSLDEMEKIISLDTSGLTVRVHGVRLREGEYLGRFGEWNLWLPYTKESSAKIAGYNPVTYNSNTEWCTAITRGSNLFYNYVGRDSFLFYIIKDNPNSDEDWLTLGVSINGSEIVFDFTGKDGGLSVNRINEGLTEEDYNRILGGSWNLIKSRIFSEIEKFKFTDEFGESRYESPVRKFIFHLANSIDDFKKEFGPKSNTEKKEFISLIRGMDPSEGVRKEILLWEAKTNPIGYINRRFINSESKGYYDINLVALKSLYAKNPMEVFSNKSLYGHLRRGGRYDNFIEEILKDLKLKNSDSFLKDYMGIVRELGYSDMDIYRASNNPSALEDSEAGIDSKLANLSRSLGYLGFIKESQLIMKLSKNLDSKVLYSDSDALDFVIKVSSDPAIGTGKKPEGSGRRLYTDENPNDTVSVKFRTKEDIEATLSKESFKSKSHKRQSQIINLIHQRVRAAYRNAKDGEVKRRLKRAYDYISKRKERSKEKTKRMKD